MIQTPFNLKILSLPILSLTLALFCTGCGVTKGYPGPQLPPDQVSRIFFRTPSSLTLEEKAIDSIPEGVFDDGLEVLPGQHEATFSTTFQERENCGSVHCHRVVERDKDGYVKDEHCDCEQSCSEEIYRSQCRVLFSSAAGRIYTITLRSGSYHYEHDVPTAVVTEQGGGIVDSHSCTPFHFDRVHYFDKNTTQNSCW